MFLISQLKVIALFAALIAGIITLFYLFIDKNKGRVWKIAFVSWFDCFYLAAFISLVFKVNQTKPPTAFSFSQIQLIPFKTILPYLYKVDLAQLLGNIIIWVPLSFVTFWTFPKLSRKNKIFLSLFLTAMVEPIQLIINLFTQPSWNIIDIDDLILNLLGTMIGILILLPFQNKKR